MSVPLVIASDERDAAAASAVAQHHAEMSGALATRAHAVLAAAARGVEGDVLASAAQLVDWCERELIPHATAEEATVYAAARRRPEGRLLVEAMLREHTVLLELVREIGSATTCLAVASAVRALQVVFDAHLEKEDVLMVPLLVAATDVSLAEVLGGLHQLVGGSRPQEGGADPDPHDRHACGCGETGDTDFPVLDARAIPHAIRHATIFGALGAVPPGGGMVLLAPHDPKPLLAQVEDRHTGAFTVQYLEQGPTDWRLAFVREATAPCTSPTP